jgi:hypothetical protein
MTRLDGTQLPLVMKVGEAANGFLGGVLLSRDLRPGWP